MSSEITAEAILRNFKDTHIAIKTSTMVAFATSVMFYFLALEQERIC